MIVADFGFAGTVLVVVAVAGAAVSFWQPWGRTHRSRSHKFRPPPCRTGSWMAAKDKDEIKRGRHK